MSSAVSFVERGEILPGLLEAAEEGGRKASAGFQARRSEMKPVTQSETQELKLKNEDDIKTELKALNASQKTVNSDSGLRIKTFKWKNY